MHVYSELVLTWLKLKNIHVPIEWVEACITWLSEEHSGKAFSVTQWETMVLEQWYFADLRELCARTLPDMMIDSPRYNYMGKPLMLQVMWARNITECCYGQIRKLEGTVNVNALVSAEDDYVDVTSIRPINQQQSSNTNSRSSETNRMLFMELTDGVKYVKAVEYLSIPHINLEKLVPGVKVSITGPLLCRRGLLMLKPSDIEILGGEVEDLSQENQTGNILRRSLASNINLNVNSNNLPLWYTTKGNNAQLNNLSNGSSSNVPSIITQSCTNASVRSSTTQNVRGPVSYEESPLSRNPFSPASFPPSCGEVTVTQNIRLPNGEKSNFAYVDLHPDNWEALSCIDCDDDHEEENGNDLVWSSDEEEEEDEIDPAILHPSDDDIIHSTPVRGTKRPLSTRDNYESRDNPPPPVKVMNNNSNMKRQPTNNNDIMFDELDDELFSQVVSDIENRAPATFSSCSSAVNQPSTSSSSRYQCIPIATSSSDYPFCYIIDLVKKIFLPNFKEGQWTIRGFVSAVISVLEISTTKPYEWQFKVRISDGSGFLDCKLANHLITTWMKISAEDAFQLRDQPNGHSILDRHLQDFKRKLSLMSGLFTVNVNHNEIPVIRDFTTPDRSTIDALSNRIK